MKKNFLRRALSLMLALFVMLTALPIEGFADDDGRKLCPSCQEWFDEDQLCPDCGKCEDCAEELHCHSCDQCCDFAVNDDGCVASGDMYCFDCLQDMHYHCTECNACFCENPEELCQDCGRCPNCASSYFGVCLDCGLCDDCQKHCPECGDCDYESNPCVYGATDHCALDCELCESCEEVCFHYTGEEPCEYCGLCENCCEANSCPDCGMCIEDPEYYSHICENCGQCLEVYPRCDNDCGMCYDCCRELAAQLGCSCGDYCYLEVSSDHICQNCGLCFGVVDQCPDCGLCVDCCAEVSLNHGCDCADPVCVLSEDWAAHFEDMHGDFLDNHSPVPQNLYSFDEDYHWRACKFCEQESHITYKAAHTFDGNGRCTTCGYSKGMTITIMRQPKDVIAKSSDDEAYEDEEWSVYNNHVKFSVVAKGKDLTYQWYVLNYPDLDGFKTKGQKISEIPGISTGTKTATLDEYVPQDFCYDGHERYFRCLISDGKNSIWTEAAKLTVIHNYTKLTGETTDKGHYVACHGIGCEAKKLIKHSFTSWEWEDEAHTKRTMTCSVCGYTKTYQSHVHADHVSFFYDTDLGLGAENWDFTGEAGYPNSKGKCYDINGNLWEINVNGHTGWCYYDGCADLPVKVSEGHDWNPWQGASNPPTSATASSTIYRTCKECEYVQYLVDSNNEPVVWKWGVHPIITKNCTASATTAQAGETIKIYAEKKANQHIIGYRITEQRFNLRTGYRDSVTTKTTTLPVLSYTVPNLIGAGTITIETLYASGCSSNHANTELKGYVEATCGRGGYTGDFVCTDCGYVVEMGEDTLPREHGELVVVDDYIYKKDSHGHYIENKRTGEYIIVARPAEEAWCYSSWIPATGERVYYTSDGYTGDKICSVCGQVVERGRTIPGYKAHTFQNYYSVCTENEPSYKRCTHCGYEEEDPSLMIRHNVDHREVRNKVAPTCTAYGYSGDTYCKDCGAFIVGGERLDPLGHKWDEGTIVSEPTAGNAGRLMYTCETCGATKTQLIEKLNDTHFAYVCDKSSATDIRVRFYPDTVTDKEIFRDMEKDTTELGIDCGAEVTGVTSFSTPSDDFKRRIDYRLLYEPTNDGTQYRIAISLGKAYRPYIVKREDYDNSSQLRLWGDANADGKTDLQDLLALQKNLAGWKVSANEIAADVNGSGKLDIGDLTTLQKHLAGWNIKFGQ